MAPPAPDPAAILRFGAFELDAKNGDLRREGAPVKLPPQPFKVLVLLATRPGQLVTREEIQHQVWSGETFVDFELGLNYCLNQIRTALGDHARTPRYIETVPRRGYRFIAPVTPVSPPAVGAGLARPREGKALPYKYVVLAAGVIIAVLVVLLALNVAGLRDRLLTAVGAGLRPAPGQVADLPLPKIRSIAVLPFENLSRDPEQEYFSDGMTEALITDLGNVGALRVISRQSVMRYKDSKKPLPEIARELKVDAIVEGTVQRSGDRVHVTANLLDARSERHLWAESYERDLRDVLTLQSEVARAIADKVKAKLTPDVQARLASARPVNPEALELYLKGSDWLERGDAKKSLEYFQQAIQNDPNFARAYVGIARVYHNLGSDEHLASVEAFAKEKAFARRALELDANLDSAHAELAAALYFGDWDWTGAERELKRALEVNPNSADTHDRYSGYLSLLDRPEEAIAEARRTLEINPVSARAYPRLGDAYYYGRRYDEALPRFQKALESNPTGSLHQFLARTYREKGLYQEAIAEFLKIPNLHLFLPAHVGHLGNAYARAGNKAEAQKILQKLVEKSSRDRTGTYAVAIIYAGLGEKDRAIEWLEKAYKVRDKGLCYMKVDPTLDPLRSDPRFQDLLRRMNFPP